MSFFKFWEKNKPIEHKEEKYEKETFIGSTSANNLDIFALEKQVLASTQEQLDKQRIQRILTLKPKVSKIASTIENEELYSQYPPKSQRNIAIASATTISLLSLLLQLPSPYNFYFLMTAFVSTFLIANRDPIKEEDLEDVTGPLTRTVGRVVLDSLEKSKPKIQAVARAVVHGDSLEDEVRHLTKRIQNLENENSQLKLWIERRNRIDEQSKYYTIEKLKDIARENKVSVGGSKTNLMMRLIEADALDLSIDKGTEITQSKT